MRKELFTLQGTGGLFQKEGGLVETIGRTGGGITEKKRGD